MAGRDAFARRARAALLPLFFSFGYVLAGEETSPISSVEARLKAREYQEAAAEARAVLADLDAKGAGDSVDAARLLDIVVESAWRGNLEDGDAPSLGQRAVKLRERLTDPQDPSVAASLHLLGNLAQARGDAAGARAFYERSLAIRETAFGLEAPEIVPSLNNLGNVTRTMGDLEASRRVLERALAIREKTLPPISRDLARSHVSLGNTLSELGALDEAERHLAKAIEILDAQQVRDFQMSTSLNTQASVLERQGKYDEAEKALRRAIANERENVGQTSDLAMYLGNLGVLRRDRGDLADARALQEEALRVEEAAPATDPSWRGLLLNNLGHLFLLMGDPSGARPVLEQALEVERRVLPADHPQIATTLQNIGHVKLLQGDVAQACADYEQALSILERTVGAHHRAYGEALVDLGSARLGQHRDAEARDLFERALAVFQEAAGPASLASVKAGIFHADALAALGEHDAARKGYEKALAIVRPTFGDTHVVLAEILARLANNLAQAGHPDEAVDAALDAEATRIRVARQALPVLPYRQALAFTAVPGGLHVALSLAARTKDPATAARVWDALLQARALALDDLTRRTAPARVSPDLEVARNRYVQFVLRGEKPQTVDEARHLMERLEQTAADAGARDRTMDPAGQPTLEKIGAELPRDAALVAYVHYRDMLAAGRPGTYAAFVLVPGAAPRMLSIGSAKEIDALVESWRREVTAPALAGVRRDTQARYDAAAGALAKRIWAPVRPYLGGARTVLLVPDGTLQLVSFPSLRASRSRYLAETGPAIHLLTAERDVGRPAPDRVGQGLLAVGAPDYEGGAAAPTPSSNIALRSPLRGGKLPPLPGTRQETDRAAKIWTASLPSESSVEVLQGAAASEEAFRAEAPGKRVLHLATHGFFLSPAGGGTAEEYGPTVLERWSRAGTQSAAQNPLLMTGLALAGANRTLAGAPPQGQDGLLLAEELASLNLTGTDWVVLSACETGLGDLVPGEGIVGLRYGALAAGAGSVVMSLWRVEDEATAGWMDALYEARLGRHASTVESLTAASRAVLASRRKAGKSTHPFYWAAFVAAGDWR